MLAIVGPNGAGKSTLLKAIVGEIKPMGGEIRLIGVKGHEIAYLPQQSTLDSSFPICIYDFVAMGLWSEYGAFHGFDQQAKVRINKAIQAVGMSGLEQKPIGYLSGGQLQRVRFARVMLQNAPLVLLDEPYSGIDNDTVRDLAALVREWNLEGRTIISVLHDYEHVRQEYRQALLLAGEVIAFGDPAEILNEQYLQNARELITTRHEAKTVAVCNQESGL